MINLMIILVATYIGLLYTFLNIFILLLKSKPSKITIHEYPTVSIIVPAYNEERNISNTLNSLVNLDYPKDKLEILVIDDGSTDNTLNIAKRFEKKYSFIKVYHKKNGGKASALNFGIRIAKGNFIVTMDSDSIVPPDALKKMLSLFNSEDVAIVIPSIQIFSPKNLVQKIQYIEYAYNNTLRAIFDRINSLYVAPGPFSIFRREFFNKCGLFDEQNITEDMEIAFRAHANGYRIRHAEEVVVYTDAPDTFKSLLRQRLRWYLGFIENYIRYRRKINSNAILSNFVMPSAILFILLPIILLTLNLYDIMKSWFLTYLYYKSINFDILPEIFYNLSNLKLFDPFMLKISLFYGGFWLTLLGITSFIIFFILLSYSLHIETQITLYHVFWALIYSSLYIIIYTIFWLYTINTKLFGREVRWGGLVWRNSLINKLINKK